MRTKIALMSALGALSALAPGAAFAQDAATAAPPPGVPGEPPPAPAAAAAAVPPPAEPGEAATPTPAPPEPAEGPKPVPGWVRIDSDGGGLQLWGGGTFPFNDSIGLAFDMYVNSGFLGEFDVGPAITAGPFIVTPMIGFQVDWNERRAQALVPQLYVVGGPSPIYSELWLQYYANSVFVDDAANQLFGRLIVDYKLTDYVALGVEADLGFDSKASDEGKGKIVSLPVGVNVLLSNVGAASSFMGFLGYETQDGYGTPAVETDPPPNNHLAGRLTFIHNF
jgi:hypothetical protein